MKKTLYKWQEECLKYWFANNGSGIVQAVTGSGKTLLALTAMEKMKKKLADKLQVKIVVPTGALMRQWERNLKEFLSDSNCTEYSAENLHRIIGLRGGGAKSPPDLPYMIYVINSARYELARQILEELKSGKNVLLIADECHRYESGQNRLIFEFFSYIEPYREHFFSLGLSATLPAGQAQHYLTSVLGPRIYHYGIAEASACQTICQYDIYHISISFQDDERREYKDLTEQMSMQYQRLLHAYPSLNGMGLKDRFEFLKHMAAGKNHKSASAASLYLALSYKRKGLVCTASSRTFCACDLIRQLDDTEKIIIFSERIQQAEKLYQILLKHYPEKVGRYHSKMGVQANKNTLERFHAGIVRILVTCKAIDEGIDVPDASTGIILSGTSSQRQRIQRLGRIIRKKEKGKKAMLYYMHIEESSEDTCYLPDLNIGCCFHLEYDFLSRQFSHPEYDRAAQTLIDSMYESGAGEDKIQEAERCLRLGRVRSDWTYAYDEIAKHIRQARHTDDKNYWICMKKLADIKNSE